MLDDDFEDNYELVAKGHKILKNVNKLAAKSNSMIKMLQIILTMLSLCILHFWHVFFSKLLRLTILETRKSRKLTLKNMWHF